MKTAYFNRFSLDLPDEAVSSCYHSGACDEDFNYYSNLINRPVEITPEKLKSELKEYGAWDENELENDEDNWKRIIWLAAGNIQEEESN